jgi:hypothetical protein
MPVVLVNKGVDDKVIIGKRRAEEKEIHSRSLTPQKALFTGTQNI